ncbi:MAG: hypothetical protein R3185_04920 [Candidatus Thermoplasmatota archaeon]|nr:hypothetical protein [Candidatus Thermoplasmatota archaeon]
MVIEKRIGILRPDRRPERQRIRLSLDAGWVHVGDTLHLQGMGYDVEDTVARLEVDGREVSEAGPGTEVDVFLTHMPIHDDAEVFVVQDPYTVEMGDVLRRFRHLDRIPPAPGLAEDPDRIRRRIR